MFLHQNFDLPNLIETGFLSIIKQKELLTQKNVNQLFRDQRTALHIAVISNQIEIVSVILKLNPDLNLYDSLGLKALDYIDLKENKHTFQQIIKSFTQFQKEQKEFKGVNEDNLNIWRASQLGLKFIEPFLTRQSGNKTKKIKNPFSKDQLGRKAIHWAAISGNIYTFNYLIQCKFDPHQQDNFGFNCYHYIMANPWNPLNTNLDKIFPNLNFQIKQNHYDVIVIGSGAAGIGAGLTLSRNGINFIVIEARNRIGGRILSTQVSGVQLDLGACWVHSYSKNNPICKEANQLKWKPRKSQKRTTDQYLSDLIQNLSQDQIRSAHIISQTYFAIVEKQAAKSQKDLSIEDAGKQYYEKYIATLSPLKKALVDMFINMTEHYHASTSKQLSAKYFNQQQDFGGDFTPDGSYHKLINAIADSVRFKDKTHFGNIVQDINYSKQNHYCQVKTKEGQVYYAKKIISSLPLGILKAQKVKFTPKLPQEHLQCIKNLGYGTMNKIIVSFEEPFWKENPSWIRMACQEKGKFPAIYNFSTQNKHILCCFVTDNFAQSISPLSDEQILASLLDVFKKSSKKQEIKVVDYKITRWDKDQYSLGSYSHFDVDSNMNTSRRLRKSIDEKLWMVGQHCYGEHIGCAHGAFQTGVWAAQEIIASFKKISFNNGKK